MLFYTQPKLLFSRKNKRMSSTVYHYYRKHKTYIYHDAFDKISFFVELLWEKVFQFTTSIT